MLDPAIWGLIGRSILETFYMVLVSTFMSYVIGLPLGVLLAVTDKDGITPCSPLYAVLGFILNMDALISEFQQMGPLLTFVFIIFFDICMLLYDRLLLPLAILYAQRLRPRLSFLK